MMMQQKQQPMVTDGPKMVEAVKVEPTKTQDSGRAGPPTRQTTTKCQFNVPMEVGASRLLEIRRRRLDKTVRNNTRASKVFADPCPPAPLVERCQSPERLQNRPAKRQRSAAAKLMARRRPEDRANVMRHVSEVSASATPVVGKRTAQERLNDVHRRVRARLALTTGTRAPSLFPGWI